MSDIKLVSPLLDGFVMGDPMSSHDGVRCCPAMKENSDDKYIVKIISVPASQKQLDALLLTGAYKDAAAATEYFKELADGIVKEAETLQQLSKLEGFLPYQGWQVVPMEDGKLGYQVYLLSSYKRSLEKFLRRNPMTHLGAVNLGLDICAALAICRRAGYMFIDLKPSNIYLTGDREYRIGDLGFVSLKSLKYASLPSKYRSCYTAPELHDALATLNPTADVYALGMILYQIYNNGQLPFQKRAPVEELPAPLNADYEMAEIIMKACAPDPRVRWQNPIEMGKALVGYMQRNTVNDTPIVPPVVQSAPAAPSEPEEDDLLAGNPAAVYDEPMVREEPAAEEAAPAEDIPADPQEAYFENTQDIPAEEPIEEDDSFYSGELAFLNDMVSDETAPDADSGEEIGDSEMTDEVSDMLAQADELISRDVPGTEIPEPEEFAASDETEQMDEDIDIDDIFPDDSPEGETDDTETQAEDSDEFTEYEKPRKKARSWVAAILIILLLALVGGGGFYFYTNYYLLTIDRLDVTGLEDSITVQLTADVDESILTVVCTDTYGNTISQNVTDGKAVFTGLNPATTYKITVEAEGFHALSGSYTGSYTTKEETNIVSFNAVTGTEDGSVILNFTVDGRETQDWMVEYSTEGEEPQSVSFTGHMVSVNNLTVGKTYTFRLVAAPASDLYITGNDTLEFTASSIIIAENLSIVSCVDGVLTAEWKAPNDAAVENWTVRCYSDDGYDETITVTENAAQFSDISTDKAYTVEVTAAGMAQGSRAYVTANPTTISDIQVKATTAHGLTVSWNHSGAAPESGWLLMYSIDGSDSQDVITSTEASATVEHCVPGATYNFTIKAADGSTVFGGQIDHTTEEAKAFDAHATSAEDIQASLCKTPDKEDWTYEDLDNDNDYTTTFSSEEKASLVLYSTKKVGTTKAETLIMYVIRDAEGNVMGELVNTESSPWADLWEDDRYAYLTIPELPSEAGSYTVEIYFDSALVLTKTLNISG